MGMTINTTRFARPALWGFFICIAVSGILLLARFFIPSYINYHWESKRTADRTRAEQVIRKAFQTRIDQLIEYRGSSIQRYILSACVNINNILALQHIFQSLNAYRLNDYQTIDLIDSQAECPCVERAKYSISLRSSVRPEFSRINNPCHTKWIAHVCNCCQEIIMSEFDVIGKRTS